MLNPFARSLTKGQRPQLHIDLRPVSTFPQLRAILEALQRLLCIPSVL